MTKIITLNLLLIGGIMNSHANIDQYLYYSRLQQTQCKGACITEVGHYITLIEKLKNGRVERMFNTTDYDLLSITTYNKNGSIVSKEETFNLVEASVHFVGGKIDKAVFEMYFDQENKKQRKHTQVAVDASDDLSAYLQKNTGNTLSLKEGSSVLKGTRLTLYDGGTPVKIKATFFDDSKNQITVFLDLTTGRLLSEQEFTGEEIKKKEAGLNEAMFVAVTKGDVKSLKKALKKGADVNAIDESGRTQHSSDLGGNPYQRTALELVSDVYSAVENEKDNISSKAYDEYERTTLGYSSIPWIAKLQAMSRFRKLKQTLPEIVGLLIEHGANAQSQIETLCLAAHRGQIEIIHALLKNGVDVNGRDKFGYTAIMSAAYSGSVADDVFKLLADAGVDINAQDNEGTTALMLAVSTNIQATYNVKPLLDAGADVNLKNNKGETALSLALAKKGTEWQNAISLLQAADAKE
ncbi:MAG: ankyrin repeat domain-containing protein [Elusimicrobiaceae bacterium]|nr:ankyrin repeat domain-containing protein [Elusimicrobiaceae bacterium]